MWWIACDIEPLTPPPKSKQKINDLYLITSWDVYFSPGLRFIDLDMGIPPFSVSGTVSLPCSRAVLETCLGVEPSPVVLDGEPGILDPLKVGGEFFRSLEDWSGVRFPCFNDLEEQGLGVRLNLEEKDGEGFGVRLNLEEKDGEGFGVRLDLEEKDEDRFGVRLNLEDNDGDGFGVRLNLEEKDGDGFGVRLNWEDNDGDRLGVRFDVAENEGKGSGVRFGLAEKVEVDSGVWNTACWGLGEHKGVDRVFRNWLGLNWAAEGVELDTGVDDGSRFRSILELGVVSDWFSVMELELGIKRAWLIRVEVGIGVELLMGVPGTWLSRVEVGIGVEVLMGVPGTNWSGEQSRKRP